MLLLSQCDVCHLTVKLKICDASTPQVCKRATHLLQASLSGALSVAAQFKMCAIWPQCFRRSSRLAARCFLTHSTRTHTVFLPFCKAPFVDWQCVIINNQKMLQKSSNFLVHCLPLMMQDNMEKMATGSTAFCTSIWQLLCGKPFDKSESGLKVRAGMASKCRHCRLHVQYMSFLRVVQVSRAWWTITDWPEAVASGQCCPCWFCFPLIDRKRHNIHRRK